MYQSWVQKKHRFINVFVPQCRFQYKGINPNFVFMFLTALRVKFRDSFIKRQPLQEPTESDLYSKTALPFQASISYNTQTERLAFILIKLMECR